jgi:amidohydrolase
MAVLDNLTALIAQEIPSLIALRRDLHAHPEVGLAEHRTAARIAHELSAARIEHVTGLAGGTGVVAHFPGAGSRAVALRADIDALPIAEESGLPYASTCPGVMHACGHDGHTAILIGAARVLATLASSERFPRPITLLFQPAEENLDGALRMIADGALAGRIGSPVEEIYALHGWPWLDVGTIGVRDGPVMAASDFFSIALEGRGSHAAWPHLAHDVVVAMSAIISGLQTIVSRSMNPCTSAVVSVCRVRAGDALNVLPQRLVFEGTVRTLGGADRARALERFEAIVHQTAAAHQCRATIKWTIGCPATVNNLEATNHVRRVIAEMPSAKLHEVTEPSMGGEDFASYGEHARASYFVLGLRPRGSESMPALHHPAFDFNDDAIAIGVEAMVRIAIGTS